MIYKLKKKIIISTTSYYIYLSYENIYCNSLFYIRKICVLECSQFVFGFFVSCLLVMSYLCLYRCPYSISHRSEVICLVPHTYPNPTMCPILLGGIFFPFRELVQVQKTATAYKNIFLSLFSYSFFLDKKK